MALIKPWFINATPPPFAQNKILIINPCGYHGMISGFPCVAYSRE
jgi:hypothetical protein